MSLTRAGVGLLIGGALGLVFGVLNGLSRLFEDLFDLPLQVARVVPFIALLPLLTITVGIGEESKITLIAIACLFPVYINTFSAVRDVDRKVVEAGKVFGLNRFQSSIQIIMPMALPGILVGIRYSMGVSLLALIVAEQINANAGVGYIIWLAQNSVRIDLIITGIIIYALLGVLVDLVMKGIERAAMPWKRAEK
ncbi:ABC transporter permease [Rhodococcus sp. O3]|uniref:ABC transporter permease n=1 Tax=Rhodococcus sp. O3 TaxID=3404919 RepID=UPI003B676A2F